MRTFVLLLTLLSLGIGLINSYGTCIYKTLHCASGLIIGLPSYFQVGSGASSPKRFLQRGSAGVDPLPADRPPWDVKFDYSTSELLTILLDGSLNSTINSSTVTHLKNSSTVETDTVERELQSVHDNSLHTYKGTPYHNKPIINNQAFAPPPKKGQYAFGIRRRGPRFAKDGKTQIMEALLAGSPWAGAIVVGCGFPGGRRHGRGGHRSGPYGSGGGRHTLDDRQVSYRLPPAWGPAMETHSSRGLGGQL